MPFKSEDQRRYLWANEPEIARDWTDTYGSRIQNNTGGISRLGFANGPNYKVDPNTVNQDLLGTADYQGEEDENYLQKFMRYMQGNAGNLSQDDVDANTKFLGDMQFSPNNPYAMTSGPFKGMNAPGTSAFGSKNPQEMATKWLKKYAHTAPTAKVHKMSELAGENQSFRGGGYEHPGSKESVATAGSPMAQGGRIGFFTGMRAEEQAAKGPAGGQTMTGGGSGVFASGNDSYQDKIMQGGAGIKGEGIKGLDLSNLGNALGKGREALGLIKLFKDRGPMGLVPWGVQQGSKWFKKKYNLNEEGTWGHSSLDDQTDDNQKLAEVTKGNLRQLKALGIFTPGKQSDYTLGDVTGSNPIVPGMEKITKDEWADILQGTYTI